MKKYSYILSFLALLLTSVTVLAQEKEKPLVEMAQDDLGNVSDSFQEYFFEALKQKAIENYEKAIDALVQCLAIDPQPVVYLELGKNYNALQKHTQAAVYLQKARETVPGNPAVLEELYKAYFLNNEFGRALEVVKSLSNIHSGFSEDLVNLYILNEQYEEAIKLLDSLDAKKGSSTARDGLRRQVYARTNNVEAQVEDLKAAILQDPTDEKSYLNLIFVYSENNRVEEAFETARQLLAVNPDSELVHLALYKFYISEENSDEAVRSMKILLGSDQIEEITKYQALNDFLIYVTQNPSLEEDLIELVQVFSKDENNNKVFGQLGTFFLEKGQKEQALEYFVRALEAESGNFGLYRDVLNLQLEFEQFEAAKDLSEKALEIFPSQPLLYLLKGMALSGMENHKEAEETLLTGLDYLIDDPKIEIRFYRQLSATYEKMNNDEKATEFLKKAGELEKLLN
ncbi:tetratricopeptide repeat protein [Salinimicrobium flavum]|uniref:Tetratricopeptide repeat protein n=1 Tax=Salinimicrobium flavum TaxID=1737065 RepID=A0ABW5IVE4_9FLAO